MNAVVNTTHLCLTPSFGMCPSAAYTLLPLEINYGIFVNVSSYLEHYI